jgi:hypothetical protein
MLAAVVTINVAIWGGDVAYLDLRGPARIVAKQARLRDELRLMRRMIDQYTADQERAPSSLEALVQAGYLAEVPKDPMTGAATTWEVILEEDPISLTGERGIVDVKSGSREIDASGEQRYSDW